MEDVLQFRMGAISMRVIIALIVVSTAATMFLNVTGNAPFQSLNLVLSFLFTFFVLFFSSLVAYLAVILPLQYLTSGRTSFYHATKLTESDRGKLYLGIQHKVV